MGQNSSSPRSRGRNVDTVPRSQNNSTSPNRSRFSPAPPIVQQGSRHNFAFQPLTQDQRSHLMNILPNNVVIEPSEPLNMPQRPRVTSVERIERREIQVNRANEVDDFMTTFLNIKEVNRAVGFSQNMMELKMMEDASADIHRDPCLGFNLEEIENNLRPNPANFDEQLALATDFNSFSSKYVTMVEAYEDTREKVAERKVLEDGRTRKKVTNTQAYRKISAGDISLREVVYNGNSNTQLQNKIGGEGNYSSLEKSSAKIIKTTQLKPMDERSYRENILENNNTSLSQGMVDSRRGSQRIEDQNMKGFESKKFVNPILNSHNSSISSIPNRKTSAFAQNKDKTIQHISNLNIDLSPSLTSLDQLAQQISSKNSPKSRAEKDNNTSLVSSRKNAPVMTPRGSNHTIPQRGPVYSPKRSEVTSPERRQEEHNFFASLVGQKPMSRKMTKESEPKEEKSMNLGQGKGYMGQIMKSPPPRPSGRYGQKTQYFQNVFRNNNANLSPKGLWEEEKSIGNVKSLRDVDETWETRETQKEIQKASTSIVSQRKEKLGEKSFTAGQRSPGRAVNLNDSSTSISKTKQQGKISTVPVKKTNGKNPLEQIIPTKKFDLSGNQSKKLNKSQLEDKKSPNTSQLREKPYPEVLRLPSNSDKETSKMDQTRSDKQFSERSDSDAVPKTEGEQDFQQPLEATLDLSAFVIPRTGNNTNKAADNYSGFDDDFFKDNRENPFQVQNKKSSGESEGNENNRSQYGRQGGGAEDLNKSNTSARGGGQNHNSKMMPQKQGNKENMYEIKGSSKNIDVSEASLDNIDDQELISEVREKLWSLSNKLQSALNSKHAPENEPRSGLSPRNPNVENKRKISREEHVQNLKFFPYQNDCLFSDEQARSPIARRPSKI